MKSIQAKFLAIVISSLLILTCAVGSVSLAMTHRILQDDADTIISTVCQKEAAQINDTLNSIQSAVHIMERYAYSTLTSPEALENTVFREAYTAKMKAMFTNIAANTDGAVAYYLRFNPECTSPTAGFHAGIETAGGQFVDFTPIDLSLYAPSDTRWYYEAVNAGTPVWLEPYRSPNSDTLIVSYVIPLYMKQQLLGVVGMDVDFSVLTQKVDSISVYENGIAYLTAADGTVVHSRSDTNDESRSSPLAGKTLKTDANLENGMRLVIQASYADIQQDSLPILFRILLIFAAVLLLSIAVTIMLTRRLVLPLKKLTVAAQQLADGNVNVELDCSSQDEVGTLSRVFIQTAGKLKEYMNYINALAYRDSLTGVKNMTAYAEAAAEMERKLQYSTPAFAVLVADINNLKHTNDTYGHDVGSQIIVRASRIICDTFKHSPVFRIGGDEFAVILENRDFDRYHELIRELDSVCARSYLTADDICIPISIARGVAAYRADIDKTFEDVFKLADHAMYLHKQSAKETQES